jgi:hypothetical protein
MNYYLNFDATGSGDLRQKADMHLLYDLTNISKSAKSTVFSKTFSVHGKLFIRAKSVCEI